MLEDLNGVIQWTQDNVSAVRLSALQGNSTFASINVTGAATMGKRAVAALTAEDAIVENRKRGRARLQANLAAATTSQ